MMTATRVAGLFLTFLCLVTVSCQKSSSGNETSGWDSFELIDPEISRAQESFGGTGRIIFKHPLESLKTQGHFLMEGEFLNDKSTMTLHTHFNGFETRDGVEIHFVRSGKNLKITASTPEFPKKVLASKPQFFDSTNHFRFRVEVHNQTVDGFHLWIWNDYVSYTGGKTSKRPQLTRKNTLASNHDMFFHTSGRGVFWGLELKKMSLTTARRTSSYMRLVE